MALLSEESRVLLIYTGGTIGMLVSESGYVPEPFFLFETLRSQTSRFHDPLGDSLLSKSRSVEGFRKWSQSQSASRDQSKSRGVSPQGRSTPGEGPLGGNARRKDILDAIGRKTGSMDGLMEQLRGRQSNNDKTPAQERQDPLTSATRSSSIGPPPKQHHGPTTLLVRSSRPMKPPPLMSTMMEELDELLGKEQTEEYQSRCVKIRDNCYEMQLPSLVTPAASSAPGGNVKRIRYAVLEVSSKPFIN